MKVTLNITDDITLSPLAGTTEIQVNCSVAKPITITLPLVKNCSESLTIVVNDTGNNSETNAIHVVSQGDNIATGDTSIKTNGGGITLKNNCSNAWYTVDTANYTFVPYTGATQNVNLGGKTLALGGITSSNVINTAQITNNAVTTAKILDGNVTSAKLAAGAGLAALFTSGVGVNESYIKTADETATALLTADGDTICLVVVHVDTTFSDGDDGTQPIFSLANNGVDFMADSVLTDATVGTTLVFATKVLDEDILSITAIPAVEATNELENGAITVTIISVPASS